MKMIYQKEFDSSKCPKCKSENVNINCEWFMFGLCNSCGQEWTDNPSEE